MGVLGLGRAVTGGVRATFLEGACPARCAALREPRRRYQTRKDLTITAGLFDPAPEAPSAEPGIAENIRRRL